MKLMLGNTPVKKMMIHNDTQDATVVASDLQAGVTCYAKGQKVTGTGKCFEFACYGIHETNLIDFVPTPINVVQVGSLDYPVRMTVALWDMHTLDFTIAQKIAEVFIGDVAYPITVSVQDGLLDVACEKTINIQIFYGKDNYV
jgi:hypothetical protein